LEKTVPDAVQRKKTDKKKKSSLSGEKELESVFGVSLWFGHGATMQSAGATMEKRLGDNQRQPSAREESQLGKERTSRKIEKSAAPLISYAKIITRFH